MGKLEEQFEARWRTAYEVRHLENQNRHKTEGAGGHKGGSQRGPAGDEAVAIQASAAAAGPPAPRAAGAQHAHTLPSTASPSSKPIRQQEVEDDEEEGLGCTAVNVAPAAAAAASVAAGGVAAAEPAASAPSAARGQEEEEPECRVVWDSSRSSAAAAPAVPVAAAASESSRLKEQGTELLRSGDLEGALKRYTAAVRAALAAKEGPEQLAVLYSNRAHVLHKLRRDQEAAADAGEAHRLLPAWPKPLFRLAQAQLALGMWAPAAMACLKGESLSKKDSEGHTEFTPLLDRLAVTAAAHGSPAGFTGILLEVRDAGDEAWLGRPAPHVPELDGPEDDDSFFPATTLPLPSAPGEGAAGATAGALATLSLSGSSAAGTAGTAGDALVSWDYRKTAAARERRRTSFRSLKEAIHAAQDGDRIILRRGTHNGMGEAVNVDKRVLIFGEGALGQTVIDQRANSPTFRITRGGVVIRNIDVDMSGFCEAVMVVGGPAVQPLIEDCIIKCSGEDGINVADQADPLFRRCVVTGKKCGARTYGSARGRFEDCTFEKCGEQGFKAMETSAPTLAGCTISECAEEGVVAMDSAQVTLVDCVITGCKGPGVDVSEAAHAAVTGGSIDSNVGGVWVWDGARATLRSAAVAGGPAHAILADGAAAVDVKECTLKGLVHATDAAWEGVLHDTNVMLDPDQPADFPPEEGPFKFVPNPYTRKQ